MTAIRWAAALTALVALAAGIISYSALAALARAVPSFVEIEERSSTLPCGVVGKGREGGDQTKEEPPMATIDRRPSIVHLVEEAPLRLPERVTIAWQVRHQSP